MDIKIKEKLENHKNIQFTFSHCFVCIAEPKKKNIKNHLTKTDMELGGVWCLCVYVVLVPLETIHTRKYA